MTHGGACGTADKLPNEATSRLVAPVRVQTVGSGLSLVSTINGFVSISQTLPLNIGLPTVFAKHSGTSNCHWKPFREGVQLLTAVQVPRVGIPSKSGSSRERPRDLQVSSSNIKRPAALVRLYTFSIVHKDHPERVVWSGKLFWGCWR